MVTKKATKPRAKKPQTREDWIKSLKAGDPVLAQVEYDAYEREGSCYESDDDQWLMGQVLHVSKKKILVEVDGMEILINKSCGQNYDDDARIYSPDDKVMNSRRVESYLRNLADSVEDLTQAELKLITDLMGKIKQL